MSSKQLESVYLMNVVLYLGTNDVPQFLQINKKAKETCERMYINPWSDVLPFEKNMKIIESTFPKLYTLKISYESYLEHHSEIQHYRRIELINKPFNMTPRFPECLTNSKRTTIRYITSPTQRFRKTKAQILETIDSIIVQMDIERLKQFCQKYKVKALKIHCRNIMFIERLHDIIQTLSPMKVIVCCLMFNPNFNFSQILFDNLIIIQPMIFSSYRIIMIDGIIIPSQNEEFIQRYYPQKVCLKTMGEKLVNFDMRWINTLEEIEFQTPIECCLPRSIKKITCVNTECKILNWNELRNIEEINCDDQFDIPEGKLIHDTCKNCIIYDKPVRVRKESYLYLFYIFFYAFKLTFQFQGGLKYNSFPYSVFCCLTFIINGIVLLMQKKHIVTENGKKLLTFNTFYNLISMIFKENWFVIVQVIFDFFLSTFHFFLLLGECKGPLTNYKYYRAVKRYTKSMKITLAFKDIETTVTEFYSSIIMKHLNRWLLGSSVLFTFIFMFADPLYSRCTIPFTLLIGVISFIYYKIFTITI